MSESRLRPLWRWTGPRLRAAQLLAEGRSQAEIAAVVGVSVDLLAAWRRTPQFAGRIEELLAEFRERVMLRGIALRERRMAAYQERHGLLCDLIAARAAATDDKSPPGSGTGLLRGPALDADVLSSLLNLERQAAQEAGQWVDRTVHQFDIDEAIEREFSSRLALPALPSGIDVVDVVDEPGSDSDSDTESG